ncbi:MAG: type II toxin-antitoxin system VapC family toxin [Sphingobacteriales bacterium]
MNYLLDTHTLIWAISDRSKLSQTARKILDNSDNTIFVSAITFWAIALKFSIGKLGINGTLPEELPELTLRMGFELISLSPEECASYHMLPITGHKDMFDRMLVWQAISRNLIFITKDERIGQYRMEGLKILW